jgi:hypothetical protein
MTQSYQLRDLGPLGAEIANGSQGIIYALEQKPGLVFKRYKNTKAVDEITLSALIDWPASLSPAEQALLQNSTAWPRAPVREGKHLVGVTMPRAPERFTFKAPDGKSQPTTLYTAINKERTHIRQDIPIPNQTERLWLAYHLCWLLALFERNGILYLDISSSNILWALDPKPEIFLLDCDSATLVWRLHSAPSVRTGNFYDPWFRNPPSHEEVRGLFSLVFARLVFARPYPNFKSRLILEPSDNPYALFFQTLINEGYSEDLAHRPSMAVWQEHIEEALGIERYRLKKVLKKTVSPFVNNPKYLKVKRFIIGYESYECGYEFQPSLPIKISIFIEDHKGKIGAAIRATIIFLFFLIIALILL